MERKNFLPEIKRTDEGSALVVIATLGVKDKDGDVLLPGAFGDQVVPVVGAHDWHSYTIGKASIREAGNEAVADVKFNDTDLGLNWYKSIKFDWNNPPPKQQYSWGFSLKAENVRFAEHEGTGVRFLSASADGAPITIHEISPVLVGAGMNTRSVDVKHLKDSPKSLLVPTHQTPTTDHPWDGPMHQRRAKASAEADYYRQLYAWHDGVSDAAQKHGWRFGHHVVAEDGTPGEASVRACVLGIALLNGEKGSSTLSADERQGVYQHLAAHLKDAGIAVPELRPLADEIGVKLDDAVTWVHWEIDSLIARFADLKDTREHKGKPPLTPDRLEQISGLKAKLDALTAVVAEQPAPADAAAAKEVFERFQALQTAINAQ